MATSAQDVLGDALSSKQRERAAYRWSVDVSVYVAQGAQRQGLGRLPYTRLLDVLTDLGHVWAHAGIMLPNAASTGRHEAMGFQNVARPANRLEARVLARRRLVVASAVPGLHVPRDTTAWDGLA